MSKSEVKKIVKRYADKLAENKYQLASVYLFGSYAKGDERKWSDIDVAVVSPLLNEVLGKAESNLWRLRRGIDLRIEPHAFSPEDWEEESNPLVREIKRTGERVV